MFIIVIIEICVLFNFEHRNELASNSNEVEEKVVMVHKNVFEIRIR